MNSFPFRVNGGDFFFICVCVMCVKSSEYPEMSSYVYQNAIAKYFFNLQFLPTLSSVDVMMYAEALHIFDYKPNECVATINYEPLGSWLFG